MWGKSQTQANEGKLQASLGVLMRSCAKIKCFKKMARYGTQDRVLAYHRALCSIYISIKVTISEPVESSGLPVLFVDSMADVSFVHNE